LTLPSKIAKQGASKERFELDGSAGYPGGIVFRTIQSAEQWLAAPHLYVFTGDHKYAKDQLAEGKQVFGVYGLITGIRNTHLYRGELHLKDSCEIDNRPISFHDRWLFFTRRLHLDQSTSLVRWVKETYAGCRNLDSLLQGLRHDIVSNSADSIWFAVELPDQQAVYAKLVWG
jgi:hypothetical protein